MKISQKGLYALQAMMMLARRHNQGAIKIRDIAYEENLPEKFLELILLEMKNARLIDGPLAPFGDAEQLRVLIDKDHAHRALYQVFLDVRNAAAKILENTTLADIVSDPQPARRARKKKKQKEPASVLPMVVHGTGSKA